MERDIPLLARDTDGIKCPEPFEKEPSRKVYIAPNAKPVTAFRTDLLSVPRVA